jgi:hypothetical protein
MLKLINFEFLTLSNVSYQELDAMHGRLKNRLKQVEDQLLEQEENVSI